MMLHLTVVRQVYTRLFADLQQAGARMHGDGIQGNAATRSLEIYAVSSFWLDEEHYFVECRTFANTLLTTRIFQANVVKFALAGRTE